MIDLQETIRRIVRLRPLGRLLNAVLIAGIRRSPYVRDARRNMLAWEQRHREREKTQRAA